MSINTEGMGEKSLFFTLNFPFVSLYFMGIIHYPNDRRKRQQITPRWT